MFLTDLDEFSATLSHTDLDQSNKPPLVQPMQRNSLLWSTFYSAKTA